MTVKRKLQRIKAKFSVLVANPQVPAGGWLLHLMLAENLIFYLKNPLSDELMSENLP